MAKKSGNGSVPVSSVKHMDKRVNIPTQELRDFVEQDEKSPKALLYPRDPSLDPQLVWKGKDDQDRQDLEVPVVPVYIQEKIQPQAIVEQVRAQARRDAPGLALLAGENPFGPAEPPTGGPLPTPERGTLPTSGPKARSSRQRGKRP